MTKNEKTVLESNLFKVCFKDLPKLASVIHRTELTKLLKIMFQVTLIPSALPRVS